MSRTTLGRVQSEILRVLWQRGKASAREISDELNARRPIAHSTVQTLLRKLEAKGAIAHSTDDRTFIYYPLIEEDSVRKSAARDLIERAFEGSAAGLVAWLLRKERIPAAELKAIRKLIDDKSSSRGPGS